MGTEGQNIVKGDVEKIIAFLRVSFADEWTAYYQYWLGAKVARGMMRNAIVSELEEHAKDEEEHAKDIAERIIELGGTPSMTPMDWNNKGECPFASPDENNILELLDQNIKSEQCAIRSYNEALPTLKDDDPVTYQMIVKILADEVEHEEDLQALLEDIKMSKNMRTSKVVEKVVKRTLRAADSGCQFVWETAKKGKKDLELVPHAICYFFFSDKSDDNPYVAGFYRMRWTDNRSMDSIMDSKTSEILLDRESEIIEAVNEKDRQALLDVMYDVEEDLQNTLK